MTYRSNAHSAAMAELMERAPFIPVLTIEDAATAVPLARALVAGGIPLLEVTLRTDAALAAIEAIAAAVPDAVVGAGTALHPDQLRAVQRAGARFIVSPGFTPELLDAADEMAVPLLPGASTASEVMTLLARGYTRQKFFPAEPSGGIAMLKALGDPIPQVRFCPTGGIDAAKAPSYLALPNVVCVGGSWVTPKDALASGDWARITELARGAAALGGRQP
ncbi:MAG TPA: bifunctional 4-hydroxy-2-oxoglutarate aldolase/2-dehydro-3-deoxy-phosphogluconate aldolase [Geminicoccaceae bacterium]|nr:bifunctional 4-hydroxy-2-oxoglutarate aldolase/2-dehydro-3-deoxy-phosphogluconate aldolase [Geminicoccaceae bacterium]